MAKPAQEKPRRRRRWLYRSALLVLLAATGAYVLATRSFVTRWVVMGQLSRLAGGEATAKSVSISPMGRLIIEEAELRAPGVAGEGGVVFKVARAEVLIDPASLFSGAPIVYSVDLTKPLVRLSQARETSAVNLASLKPAKTGGSNPGIVPQVVVRGGVIELGEHWVDAAAGGAAVYNVLKQIAVSGELEESPDERGAQVLRMRQVDGDAYAPGGLRVYGRLAPESVTLNLEGFSLNDWTPESIPSAGRELFRRTALDGRIPAASVTYAYAGGWQARIELADVALNLPLQTQPSEDGDGNVIPLPPEEIGRLMRMNNVNGHIVFSNTGVTAALKGLLEEVPYDVTFALKGTDPDGPFSARLVSNNFRLEANPEVILFAPPTARRRLGQFGEPTALVDAEVSISREGGSPDAPGKLDVEGKLTIREGSAAFEKFPYRFNDLTGVISFTSDSLTIEQLVGVSPSGARIRASGKLAPLSDESVVDLHFLVENLVIDEPLARAMGTRRKIIDALFNEPAYHRLLEQGLVVSSAQHAAATKALAMANAETTGVEELRRVVATPIFDLGGRATVDVIITRRPDDPERWRDTQIIQLGDMGMLSERVPFPLRTRGVKIIKENAAARIEGGIYQGVTGGSAQVEASVDFEKLEEEGVPFVPELSISAKGVPADDLLISAIPGEADGVRRLKESLRTLRLEGPVDITARVGLSSQDETVYTVDLAAQGLSARPLAVGREGEGLVLGGVTGAVRVSQDGASVDLSGLVRSPARPEASGGVAATVGTGAGADSEVRLTAQAAFVDGGVDSLELTVVSPRLNLEAPVEDAIGAFTTEAAAAIAQRRREFVPAGEASLSVEMKTQGEVTNLAVRVDHVERIEATVGGERVFGTKPPAKDEDGNVIEGAAADRAGLLVLRSKTDVPTTVTFNDFALALGTPEGVMGTASVDGTVRLDAAAAGAPGGRGMAPVEGVPLRIKLREAVIHSGLFKGVLSKAAPSLAAKRDELDVRGVTDVDVTVAGRADGRIVAEGFVEPRSVGFVWNGAAVRFDTVDGRVYFDEGGGRLASLSVAAPAWSASLDGSWLNRAEGGVAFESSLFLTSQGVQKDLEGLLPEGVRDALGAIAFKSEGPLVLHRGNVSVTTDSAGAIAGVKAIGRMSFENARADIGQALTQARGVIDFEASRIGAQAPTEFELWTLLDSFRLANVRMTAGRARLLGATDTAVAVPYFSADVHGGRIAGDATIGATPADGSAREFQARVQAADVRFASLLADLAPEARGEGMADEVGDDAGAGGPDASRGVLDGSIGVAGRLNDPASRRGRGTAVIGGGRVVNLPLLVPLIRVTNLQLPINERLDYAAADFFLQGNIVSFEELSVQSSSVGVYGFGTATLPEMSLDLRFTSKNRSRIPLLTGMFEGIRNELVTVVVQGTLGEPDIGMVTLTGTTRLLGRIFGAEQDEQQRRLRAIQDRADQNPPRRTAPSAPDPVRE